LWGIDEASLLREKLKQQGKENGDNGLAKQNRN
jgi:hypothetical protein